MREHNDHDDDDRGALRGIDLEAWAPPPAQAVDSLADAVVARMRRPAAAAAVDGEGARGGRRRRWIAVAAGGAAVGAAVAVAAVILLGRGGASGPPVPAPGHGEVFAARASRLSLGSTTAELDPGAEVRWRRQGHRIEAVQPRGAVAWRVGGGDTLVIDAGATVASVEAHGASLRVEVQMNRTDMRVLGASAVTAAAVALITVVVYEGHVKASSEGRTVVVEPGATFEVRPEAPDREGLAVGGGVALDEMRRELRALQERVEAAEKALAVKESPDPAPAPPAPADKTSPFMPVRPPPVRAGCDDEALTERGREQFSNGQFAAAYVTFDQAYACRPDPSHAEKAIVAACNLPSVEKAARQWRRLPPAQRNRILGVCVRNGITEEMLADGAARP